MIIADSVISMLKHMTPTFLTYFRDWLFHYAKNNRILVITASWPFGLSGKVLLHYNKIPFIFNMSFR